MGLGARVELAGEAAALAVVGLGEVDELEVKAEGTGELVGGRFAEGFDGAQGMLEGIGCGGGARLCAGGAGGDACGINFAIGDGGLAELFDGFEDGDAGLLAEDFSEQHAQRADVAAQGSFLELAGGRLEFGQALRPVGRGPE